MEVHLFGKIFWLASKATSHGMEVFYIVLLNIYFYLEVNSLEVNSSFTFNLNLKYGVQLLFLLSWANNVGDPFSYFIYAY